MSIGRLMRQICQICLMILIVAMTSPQALATNYQQCETSTTCTIGEYLYQDNYTPLTGASCTLTAKYPDDTSFLSSVAMTGGSDGWYRYDATIGTTEGLYHATICCTPSDGLMCLDKSFEVKTPIVSGATAADIWSYSGRTLTSYGTLVNDIWNASTRSLTTFGSLIGDVWGYSGRTLTSFGTLVSSITGLSDASAPSAPPSLQSIAAEQETQRQLLEQLVNEPIVSLSLEDGANLPSLESKLEKSREQANDLYDTISSSKSRLMTLDAKWNQLSQSSVLDELTSLTNLLDSPQSLAELKKSWDHPTVNSLNSGFADLKTSLNQLLTSTSITKKSLAPGSLLASLKIIDNLEAVLGDSVSSSSDATLYGYLAFVSERDSTLESENHKLSGLLDSLNGQGNNVSTQAVSSIKSRLLALNEYPGGEKLVNPAKSSPDDKLNLKNILFSLQGLVGLNRQLLAVNVGDPIRSLWLEEGSIIFRAVITNPSSIIAQTVPLKFYLPREVKTADIITLDPNLEVTYDSGEEALYAHGDFTLDPKETKIVYVEIEDVWQLTGTEIENLKNQAANLLEPLKKTSYYSQGVTLKSDIDTTLSKILLTTSQAVTPENRIRTYREGKLELAKVQVNMDRLEDLVAQSSGTGSLFGFVGGVQTIAVWGIILVIVAGFVFLTLYFKKLGINPPPEVGVPAPKTSLESVPSNPRLSLPLAIVITVAVTAGVTVLLTRDHPSPVPASVSEIESSPVSSPAPLTPAPSEITIKEPKDVLGKTASPTPTQLTLTVPPDSSVNIRNRPSAEADIVMAIKQTISVYVFESLGDWSQIGLTQNDQSKSYWVHTRFLTPLSNQ